MPLYELVCISKAVARQIPKKPIPAPSPRPRQSVFGPTSPSAHPLASSTQPKSTFSAFNSAPEPEKADEVIPLTPTEALMKMAATQIMDRKGVVKGFSIMEQNRQLVYRMKRHQTIFDKGDTWTMEFYASPQSVRQMSKSLNFDERVIRHTVVKLGESLSELTGYRRPENIV
ncbi:uncharacterized protein EV422DRAFT_215595 [Fimicolochytrium jonesii]|uniref:uncharacterized protein n=1 Tax=Fimicolochytrium jonesii TaxID=1396493 RepID=UPI0022FE2E8F|nr:uncharacterized protein EV422DRAFT_215595 [Fimicolochytrium jonesii]KAI8817503.1 hypothetical protein EV422DRAFT_215595 [Fimicolochytrium jonesii]